MTTYYKGNLVLSKNISLNEIKYRSCLYIVISCMSIEKISSNKKITNEELEKLNAWKNLTYIVKDSISSNNTINDYSKQELLFNLLKMNYKQEEIQIIYEIIYDINGNPYAKEKNYNLIFPLFNFQDLDYFIFNNVHEGGFYNRIRGKFSFALKKRNGFDLTDCYCFEYGVANKNEIDDYIKNYGANGVNASEFYNNLIYLYNMNVFDDNIIKVNTSNSTSNTISNKQTNNIPDSYNIQQSINQINSSNLENQNTINSNSTLSNSPTSTKLETLKNIKNLLNYLPDEDVALLKDMTNNNLDDPNILEYLKMSRNEKLEFLKQKSNQNKPKVSLKKK